MQAVTLKECDPAILAQKEKNSVTPDFSPFFCYKDLISLFILAALSANTYLNFS